MFFSLKFLRGVGNFLQKVPHEDQAYKRFVVQVLTFNRKRAFKILEVIT